MEERSTHHSSFRGSLLGLEEDCIAGVACLALDGGVGELQGYPSVSRMSLQQTRRQKHKDAHAQS